MAVKAVSGASLQKTTNYKVILPFYGYATFSLIIGVFLLLLHSGTIVGNTFDQRTLAIVHTMALGWGTMTILGASYQLLPVLIEGELFSDWIGYFTFLFTAIGIPILVYGFYHFDFLNIDLLKTGAILVNIGVLFYVVNVTISSLKSDVRSVHAWYIIIASLWLFSTTFFGLLLVLNFRDPSILGGNSLQFFTIHAHLGLVGWFLLLVIGVGSRLIPMFLISKYVNVRNLWYIFFLINAALISFLVFKLIGWPMTTYYISIGLGLIGIFLFARHIYKAYLVRIRKGVDTLVKTSMFSVAFIMAPLLLLLVLLLLLPSGNANIRLEILYGFTILFGWITAIIYGMTFKTLPFIVFNKVYHNKKKQRVVSKPPAPKDLYNQKVYDTMLIFYFAGFFIFVIGILLNQAIILKVGAIGLLISALLYGFNSIKTIFHQQTEAK